MSEAKVSNQQLQAYRQDRMEGVTYSWEWPKLHDAMHDLLDARARVAKLESIIKTLHEELKDRYYVREDCGGYDPSYEWFDRLEELMEEKGIQL